jgi:4-hydroxy-tetrahydrodipicolinate reductase
MGQRIATLAAESGQFEIVCAMERAGHPDMGKNYGAMIGKDQIKAVIGQKLEGNPEVVIDFTIPESTKGWVDAAVAAKTKLVIGTTGLGEAELGHIREAGKKIAVVQAPNMSVGMNLLFRVVTDMTKALGSDYDIEIVEQHHRFKKDAPSGSALGLLNSVAAGLGKNAKDIAVFGREGKEASRKPGEVGVHAVRLGDTVGEHVVYFGTLGETVSISHSAHSRDTFAQGSLRAAKWLMGKETGVYSMQDVLFGNKE